MRVPRRFRCVHCAGEVPCGIDGESNLQCPACRATFRLDHGIVVLTEADDDRDYPAALVDLVARVERRHFWFAARNDVILSTIRRVTGALPGKRLLDVGCGTGFVTAALEAAGMDVWGIDMHLGSLQRARARVRGPLFANQSFTLPFFPDFELATLFDVIEHIDDDVAVLREASRVLSPGGHVVVTVPAESRLFTTYDRVIGHKRRYDRESLVAALTAARLDVRYVGYFSCLPLLVQSVQRRLTRGAEPGCEDVEAIVERALKVPPKPINELLRLSVKWEGPFRHLPGVRGGSLIAVATATPSHS